MSARVKIISSMLIFSTIGLLRRSIAMPSAVLAMLRGVIGLVFLLFVMRLGGKRMDTRAVRSKLLRMCVSGIMMGANWILLFEAYNYTSIAVATLCYYLAPMFVILASSALFRERMGIQKGLCVVVAFGGMVCVSGIIGSSIVGMKGILLSLGAALLYAGVVLINKGTGGVNAYDRTIVQLASSSIAILPYVLLTDGFMDVSLDWGGALLTLVAGIVHTGIAYALYFDSLKDLRAQAAALFSYIDPVGAVLLSALFLGEKMSFLTALGALLVIGAAVVSEMPLRRHKRISCD